MGLPKYLLLIVALVLAACASDTEATTTSTSEATSTTVTTSPTTSVVDTTTTSVASTTTTTTSLPGEPIDFGPDEGDMLMVIGVEHDDVLNLRRLPGPSHEIVDTIPSDYRELEALGNTRDLDPSFWIEVDYEGTTGWVHMSFVGFEGVTEDVTAFVVGELGERPTAETMAELGLTVAEIFASDEPESDLIMVVPQSAGDLSEVTYDVIGLGDDAVRGLRVHVFAEPMSDGFSLHTVEVTSLCGRGVTTDRLCV